MRFGTALAGKKWAILAPPRGPLAGKPAHLDNGTNNTDHLSSITDRTVALPTGANANTGAFKNGSTYSVAHDDFDGAYSAINSYKQGSIGGSYTVRGGETLSSLAQSLYGDSGLWYKIAQANGLTAETPLIQGQSLILPSGVVKSVHNANSIKPFDPSEARGDLSPTTPEPPKESSGKGGKCGVFGKILLVVVAVVVTLATQDYSGTLATAILGTGASSTAISIVGGAIAATAGSIASQVVGVATGIQDKFSWKGVAMAAISGGVSGGLGGVIKGSGFFAGAARGAAGSAISQGIGVATGLQESFSWVSVAAAGIGGGIGALAGKWASGKSHSFAQNTLDLKANSSAELRVAGAITAGVKGVASALANAATRSAIEGSNFGDNIIAAIPDVIGQALSGYISACFTGETLIHTPNGTKPIADIKIGDWVLARDEDFNTPTVHRKRVEELFRYEDRATLDATITDEHGNPVTIRTTPEHPFAITNDGKTIFSWVAAGDLEVGQRTIDINDKLGTVTKLEPVEGLHTVHNFSVEGDRTYFVSEMGVWVHNTYGAIESDSLARQLKAKEFREKYGSSFDPGTTAKESLDFAEQHLKGFLDAASGGGRVHSSQKQFLLDLAELRGYSVSQLDGLGFLSKTQRASLSEIFATDGGIDQITTIIAARRSYSDYVEANPLIKNSLAALYHDGGTLRGVSYFDFQNNVIDNFVTGESFSTNAGYKDFRKFLSSAQVGNREIYQSLIGGLFQGATSVLAADISTIIDQAASLNTMGLVEAASGAIGGIAVLRKGAFLRRTSSGDKVLPPSLAQQKALTRFASEERALLKNFDTFEKTLSKRELRAVRKHPYLARVYFGTHLEIRVAGRVQSARGNSPGGIYDGLAWTGRGNKPNDFIGSGGTRFDLTTNNPTAIVSHQNRSAVDAVVTYDSLPNSFGYDFVKSIGGQ